MTLDPKWVPMKWPCGPLEIARRSKSGSINADVKDVLESWSHPSALELLKGTPVNCLIVEWASGEPEDSTQQKGLKPLLEEGRRLGVSFVARVSVAEGAEAAVAAARAAGIAAVMLGPGSGRSFDLPVILQYPRDKVAWETTSSIFAATENDWPGVKLETMNGDTAQAGPTGIPWVNSNDWFSLLAGTFAPGRTLWLDSEPPDSSTLAHPANYELAVADSRANGSQWIISLDDKLRAALTQGNGPAKDIWKRLCEAVEFFDRHRAWDRFKPQGVLAVTSDFAGENSSLSEEVLNLLSRREIQFRISPRSRPLPAFGQGVKAILWLDPEAPGAEQHSQLLAFVRQGGLLIASAYWGPQEVKPMQKDPSLDYKMYDIGKGQIAVAEEAFQDPYQVAQEAHLLVSRRSDLVRLYNPNATSCHLSIDPGTGRRLIQVLNYSAQPADSLTLWVNARVGPGTLWRLGSKEAVAVRDVAAERGTYFDLPSLSVYGALECGGSSL